MKLEYCLVACDLNAKYLDYFDLVREAWLKIVGVETRLVLIADHIPAGLEAHRDSIILFPPLDGIHTAFQAQCIRLLYPGLIDSDKGVIVSDMDMIPLSRRYFRDPVTKLGDDKFVVYRTRTIEKKHGQLPICYNAAAPQTWARIFGVRDQQDVCRLLGAWWQEFGQSWGLRTGEGWCADQIQLLRHVEADRDGIVVRLTDRQTRHYRMDRLKIDRSRIRRTWSSVALKLGLYTDYHMMSPPSAYRAFNAQVLNTAASRNR